MRARTMTERQVLAREMADASQTRHEECRRLLDYLDRARQAILAVQRGDSGAADHLERLTRDMFYGGQYFDVRLDRLLRAEEDRCAALARLEEIDGADVEA